LKDCTKTGPGLEISATLNLKVGEKERKPTPGPEGVPGVRRRS